MKDTPFYPHSFAEAKRNDEQERYVLSHQANIECKKAIENIIKDNYDGYRLGKDLAKAVIDEFGFDRVKYVLANTVQHFDYDGRISRDNKAWATETFIAPDIVGSSDRNNNLVITSHAGLVDLFVNQYRKEYKALNLWDKSQMNTVSGLDFKDKVMVLNPSILKDEYKTRDFQLIHCVGGFGCSPTARGRSVFGEFLKDGEKVEYHRTDFIGEAKAEFLPQWAKDKIAERKPSVLQKLQENKEQIQKEKSDPKKELKQDKEVR